MKKITDKRDLMHCYWLLKKEKVEEFNHFVRDRIITLDRLRVKLQLVHKNLSGVDCMLSAQSSNFRYSNFRYSDFSGSNFRYSNFRYSDFSGSNFSGSDFSNSTLLLVCPEEGSFIGWKKCRDNVIVKLKITENALRSSATTRKCRASEAVVLEIYGAEIAISKHDPNFMYTKGQIIKIDNFDKNRFNECSTGIHFFITRHEAENY